MTKTGIGLAVTFSLQIIVATTLLITTTPRVALAGTNCAESLFLNYTNTLVCADSGTWYCSPTPRQCDSWCEAVDPMTYDALQGLCNLCVDALVAICMDDCILGGGSSQQCDLYCNDYYAPDYEACEGFEEQLCPECYGFY